jgi:UDPglucose--hexose-1-phosphate uridylyltransferase
MGGSEKGFLALNGPHRRYNPLGDEWVLVSAVRLRRPWLGAEERPPSVDLPDYDPACYLCPGNTRVGGERNDDYKSTFVFTNDFSALVPDSPIGFFQDGLLRAEGQRGTCQVVCFSPQHNLSLPKMSSSQVRTVVDLWATQSTELGKLYRWVQVFENRGVAMGGSNPHPHGQIWASEGLPTQAAREDASQRRFHVETGRSMLIDYAEQEVGGPRQVELDDDWLVVVPFWAAWPYETMVIPRRPAARLEDLDDSRRDSLSRRLIGLMQRYDKLFGTELPYSMGWHQAPYGDEGQAHWQLHAHFFPPLIQATTRKFMVGYELLSEPQRDITAESAAERLRTSIGCVSAPLDSQS